MEPNMDANDRRIRQGRATNKAQTGCSSTLAGLLIWCAFAVGCAVVEPPETKVSTEQTPVSKNQAITRLEAGRTGFVITETPKFLTTWGNDFERAVALMQDDKEKQAMPILEEIVGQSPGVTAPYINLAMIYRHAGQYEQAEELLQEALKLVPDHPIELTRWQVVNCYMGRVGLINSGGASGSNDLAQAVTTAVINKRAGGMGLISGRKAFQRPMAEGVEILNAIQDVYLSDEVSIALCSMRNNCRP